MKNNNNIDLIWCTDSIKSFYMIIQFYIIISINIVNSHTHNLKDYVNRKIWLDNSIKVFYTIIY